VTSDLSVHYKSELMCEDLKFLKYIVYITVLLESHSLLALNVLVSPTKCYSDKCTHPEFNSFTKTVIHKDSSPVTG
jgi:hypothetical protein